MIHRLKKGFALLLALTLTAMPLMAWAEADFDPGTLFQTLLAEVFESGRMVEGVVSFHVDTLPSTEDAEEQKLVNAIGEFINSVRVHISAVDDYDQKLYSLILFIGQEQLADMRVRTDADTIRLTSSLLPGTTLVMPMMSTNVFSEGGNEDIATLMAGFLAYYQRVAGWVSQKQFENEDLYVYESVEIDETETRDAVSMLMNCNVRSADLKQLLRSLADTFYDDQASQQAVTNLLAPLGVTRAQVRQFADELPLIVAHELEANDSAAVFTVSYDDDLGIAGFDGVMPAMFDPFFFKEGSFNYSRKIGLDDTRYTAHGVMGFEDQGSLTGDLAISVGEIIDNARRDESSISLEYVHGDDGSPSESADTREPMKTLFANVNQGLYLAEDNLDVFDGVSKIDVTQINSGSENTLFHAEMSVHSATKLVDDVDLSHATTFTLDTTGPFGMTVQCDITSKEYVPTEWVDVGTVSDLSTLDAEQTQSMMDSLTYMPVRLILLIASKLPTEVFKGMTNF